MTYALLQQHHRIANRRHPMFDTNRFARVILFILAAVLLINLFVTGMLLPAIMRDVAPYKTPSLFFNEGMSLLLLFDFCIRFLYQKIPRQEIKPYILLPIGKRVLIHCFLVRSALGPQNLYWMSMLLPFAALAIYPAHGIFGVLGWLIGYWILFLVNNYWYLFCRALINLNVVFVLLPLLLYGSSFSLMALLPDHCITNLCIQLGESFITWDLLWWLLPLALLAFLYFINLALQQHLVYLELSESEKTGNLNNYSFLSRWGEIGEYLRLEIKLQSRNRNLRRNILTGFSIMFMYAALLCFYPNEGSEAPFMLKFYSLFIFAIPSIMSLVKIMCPEGNYLDGVLCRKESILSLLKAKYWFNSLLLIIPLLLSIPAVMMGRISWLMVFAYLFTASGPLFALLFQLTVYNRHTLTLNSSVTGKQLNTASQALVSMAAFLAPLLIDEGFALLFGDTTGLRLLLFTGILLTALHPMWLRNVYRRFMKRRYINMDGYRATR